MWCNVCLHSKGIVKCHFVLEVSFKFVYTEFYVPDIVNKYNSKQLIVYFLLMELKFMASTGWRNWNYEQQISVNIYENSHIQTRATFDEEYKVWVEE